MKPNVGSALLALALAALAPLAGCPAPAATPAPVEPTPTTTDPQPPASTDPVLTADGRHFAAARTYQGECAPAGSRGGCYSLTLEPDGRFRHMLLDAAVSGTYVIAGDQVQLTPDGAAPPQSLPLSPDRGKVGDYVLKAEPTAN